MLESTWEPKNNEDDWLKTYHAQHVGQVFTEVPIGWSRGNGNWAEHGQVRYIDAIRFPDAKDSEEIYRFSDGPDRFLDLVDGAAVELIEVKRKLNRLVIGQLVAGFEMFHRDYDAEFVKKVALCTVPDERQEWVCDRLHIAVEYVAPDEP